jgi:maleylpyruvate isomerase
MTSPTHDTVVLRESTHHLLAAAGKLNDAAVADPSALPGWTRGHVLTHLARNAEALVNVLQGRPMYANEQARDADIASGADRPLAVQLDDVRGSAARLDQVMAALTDEQWRRTVELRGGVTDLAAAIPFRRQFEVELHHIDLGIGRTTDDLPHAFTDRALEYLTTRFADRPEVPPIELRAEDGRSWRTGREGNGAPQVVTGPPTALVGWLSGRTTGSGLTTGGASLPTLPPL